MMSQPASSDSLASSVHSSSVLPIMEETITFDGNSRFSRRSISRFSFSGWSEICSRFLNPTNGVDSLPMASNRGETSSGLMKPIVL